MKRAPSIALAFLALLALPLTAQQPVPLERAATHVDSLAGEEVDVFTMSLAADQFVVGQVSQRTVDVVVEVLGPDGRRVARVDGPARGLERFQFETDAAGEYRIEVSPFEGATGSYAIRVDRVEPVATEPAARVDQIMAAYSDDSVPGGVVAVIRDGDPVFARGYGSANLTYGIPFTTATRTNIGSTSKQFTAFAIGLLAERGQLSLDDDIREYIPELPDFGQTITLRNLLTHTSGYREFINALVLTGRRLQESDYIGRFEVLDLLQRQPELQNEPGAEFNYNNSGFSLLTLVVERITGQDFPEWMRENVFLPLGMESTFVRADPMEIIPGSAQGYVPADDGWLEARDLGASMGAGGIYTTVGDLARWVDNFDEPRVGGPGMFDRLTTRFVLTDGDTTSYGLGLFVDEYRGLERVHHGGADVAHRSMLRYYPELDAAVVALSNNGTFNSGSIADQVADVFFGEHMEPEEEAETTVAGDFDPESYEPEEFDQLAGDYALEAAPSMIASFFREDDRFYTQLTGQPRVEIRPTSDSTFELTIVDASVTFHRNDEGVADSATLYQNGGEMLAHRVEDGETEAWEPSVAELREYTGRYFSEELETFYTVTIQDEELVVLLRRLEDPVTLTPGDEPDVFTGGFPIANLEFVRENGEVVGLEVGNVRTRDVRFDRVD